jgi:WD40 repeat protein
VAGGHHGAIEGVAYTLGNPTMLLTAGANGRFLFRNPDTAEQLEASPRVGWGLSCIAVSAKPIRVATGGSGNLNLWSMAEGDRVFRGVRGLRQVALSLDGKFLAAAEAYGKARLWELSSEAEPRVLEASSSSKQVYGVQFSPDGKLLATCAGDGMIKLWEPTSGKLQREWSGHQGKALALVFTPDGQRLFSGGADQRVRLWDVGSAKQLAELEGAPSPISCLALSSDGNRLAAGTRHLSSATEPCALLVWDTAQRKLLAQLQGHKGSITGVAIAPDGKTIASTSSDMTVRLWAMPDAAARPVATSSPESKRTAPPSKPSKSQPGTPAAAPK